MTDKLDEYIKRVGNKETCNDIMVVGLVIYGVCALDKDHDGPHVAFDEITKWQYEEYD